MRKIRIVTGLFILAICCLQTSCGTNKTPAQQSAGNAAEAPKKSIVQKLKESDHLPVEERIALYTQLKKEQPDEYNFANENELTMYGYSMLWDNKVKDAIAIFALIVNEFPQSANAYDSLGEAYLADGETALSLANYEKSLAMNPDNFHAEDQIESIKFPGRPVEKPGDKFVKILTAQQYRDDLDQLGNTLLKVHPNALKFITKKDFWAAVEQKKALVTDRTTFGEFAWLCSEIIANVHCSHTDMGRFFIENEMLPTRLRFPVALRMVDQRIYVVDPVNNADKVKLKDEIVSINGLPVDQLIARIYPHIPAQGYIQTTKRHVFNMQSAVLIPYALGFPETYTVEVKGKKQPITLTRAADKVNPPSNPIFHCRENLCLDFLDDQKTAVMSIVSFNYYSFNDLDVFKKFVDKSMAEINSKGIKNLIIDVRWNGGGSQSASIHLLRYLVPKPFVYYSTVKFEGKTEKIEGEEMVEPFEKQFKGKLYFMMDGLGNSTTGHFMSLVKVMNLGKIVGEELGSNQFCSAGQTACRLKHSKLEYYVANNTHESTATSLPDETGILPDHYVTQSIEEYLNKTDRVKEFTIRLAQQNN